MPRSEGTFQTKITGRKAKIVVFSDGSGNISQSGGLLLETVRATGLGRRLSAGLERWREPRAIHDPGKIVTDLAVLLALGGDCLSDVAMLRSQPELFGPVASDPTVSRLVDALAADPVRALKSVRTARAAAREPGPQASGLVSARERRPIGARNVAASRKAAGGRRAWRAAWRHHARDGRTRPPHVHRSRPPWTMPDQRRGRRRLRHTGGPTHQDMRLGRSRTRRADPAHGQRDPPTTRPSPPAPPPAQPPAPLVLLETPPPCPSPTLPLPAPTTTHRPPSAAGVLKSVTFGPCGRGPPEINVRHRVRRFLRQ
jgi:hypothetical protein